MEISTKLCYYVLWMHILSRSDDLKLKCLNGGFLNNKRKVFFYFTRCKLMDLSRVWVICGLLCFLSAV